MKKLHQTLAISVAMTLGALSGAASAQVTLNVISGGSQNMVEYVTDYLGPLFEKQNPGASLKAAGGALINLTADSYEIFGVRIPRTVVIGGVYEFSDTTDLSKVPFLGDLPVIGNLFRNKSRSKSKAELLIFVTPKVMRVSQR